MQTYQQGGRRGHGAVPNNVLQNNSSTEQYLALMTIPADIPRDEWVKVAAAWKSAGGDFATWDEWSRNAINYHAKDAKNVWKSLSAQGGIGPATLIYIARQYGYNGNSKSPYQSEPEFSLLIEQKKQQQQEADKARHKSSQKARDRANEILDCCDYARPNHPYFISKHISPLIPVWQLKQSIVIPVMDLRGEVHSLQFIKPDGNKTFLKDGVIKGHFFQIWSRKKPSDAIVVCEGYATAVTLASHYTPDCSVVVAFNAGNLKPVAKIFRMAFFDSQIIIAGDRDASGVGQKAAEEAALAVGGKLSIPPFEQGEAGSDWNDFWLSRLREVTV